MPRKATITAKRKTGMVNTFRLWVDGVLTKTADGSAGLSWTGEVGTPLRLKLRVAGIGSASYELKIDLPGIADDVELTPKLSGGVHVFSIGI